MAASGPKIGEGTFSAWMRQGLREVRAMLYPESNVAQQTEYGLYGTRTPGEVAADRRGDGRDAKDMDEEKDQYPSVADRVQEAKDRSDEMEPAKQQEMERE
ncbi:MAG: hypothetical protein KF708_09025 [Pirellulales bacterium]|nr:hypothetical protein [Pirellulales bacterium]